MPELTYVAVKPLTIAGERREAGELVPEAEGWRNVAAYISNGTIAPVPKDSVDTSQLREAEDRRQAINARAQASARQFDRSTSVTSDEVEELTEEHTRDELYEQAQDLDIDGRSSMDKEELAEAVAEADDAAADLDDELEQYHVGKGWYEVPGSEKKLRREDALEALTSEGETGE